MKRIEKCRMYALATSVALCSLGVSTPAVAYVIGGIDYAATGPVEQMNALFTQADGGVSIGTYSGLVEVLVSGTGQSYFTSFNDAFHVFAGDLPTAQDAGYYQLTFGRSTLVGSDITQDAANAIVYDIDVGQEVTSPYRPAYQSGHSYAFVLDVGTPKTTLHFGVADGGFNDNTGFYTLTLRQLTETQNDIPEPAVLALFGIGLFGLVFTRRRS